MTSPSTDVTPAAFVARAWNSLRRQLLGRRAEPEQITQDYKVQFPDTARAFAQFLDRLPTVSPNDGRVVGVVVLPWVATPLPWFAIAAAFGLLRRGRRVELIWDDTDFEIGVPTAQDQNAVIAPILRRVESALPVSCLSGQRRSKAAPRDRAMVARLAELNVEWRLRGAEPEESDAKRGRALEKNLDNTLRRLRTLVANHDLEYLVVPGGVWGSTGLYLEAGSEAGVRVSTYDAGTGWCQSSNSGPAARQTDIPAAFETLWCDDGVALAPLIEAGRDEFDARVGGRDRALFQTIGSISSTASDPADVMIPMNVDHDSAALGRHLHFAGTSEWVTETVAFVLAHSRANVVVRQHPSERKEAERGRSTVGRDLHDRFGDDPRFRFVTAVEPTSSYDLLAAASLVLPYVSTFGIEAAALGKTVLVAGDSYYAGLGFVYSARSRSEYFALLERGLAGQLPLLADQVERAWLCFYLSQCCNRVWTEFTPQPEDFWKWCERSPEDLFDDPTVSDLLTSIDEDIPLALVRHRRSFPT